MSTERTRCKSFSTLPATAMLSKSTAVEEFPDGEALRAAGIDLDLPMARLVAMVLSRHLVFTARQRHRNTTHTNMIYEAMRLVVPAFALEMRLELPGDDGALHVVTCKPEADAVVVPNGRSAQRHLQADGYALRRLWSSGSTYSSSCFARDILLTHLNGPAWRHIGLLIERSVEEDRQRLEAAVAHRRRRAGPKKVAAELSNARGLISQIVYLAETYGAALHPELDHWRGIRGDFVLADVQLAGEGGRRRDVTAPPLPRVQAALLAHARDAEWGHHAPEMYPSDCRLRRSLRRLVVLILLCVFGFRVGTAVDLNVDDFETEHYFHDGSVGPALRLRGEGVKNENPGEEAWWRVPAEIALIFHAWIVCSGRAIEQKGEPFLVNERGCRCDKTSFTNWARGSRRNRPLVPLPRETVSGSGYEAHRLRHLVQQSIRRLWSRWRRMYPTHELADIDPKEASKMLLIHGQDDYGYGDFEAASRKEPVLALALEMLWRHIRSADFPLVAGTTTLEEDRAATLRGALATAEDELLAICAEQIDSGLDADLAEQLMRLVSLAMPALNRPWQKAA